MLAQSAGVSGSAWSVVHSPVFGSTRLQHQARNCQQVRRLQSRSSQSAQDHQQEPLSVAEGETAVQQCTGAQQQGQRGSCLQCAKRYSQRRIGQ